MLLAMTSWTPASSSLYGAVSRDLPHPFDCPLTMTPKPPFLIASASPSAAQADEAIPGERLVVVVANPPGGDLVGGDVADEGGLRLSNVIVLAGELRFDERRIFGEVEDAAADGDWLAFLAHHEDRSLPRSCRL